MTSANVDASGAASVAGHVRRSRLAALRALPVPLLALIIAFLIATTAYAAYIVYTQVVQPAIQAAQTYGVSFNANGATAGSMHEQRIPASTGEPLSANEYARDGYEFQGWNTESDGSGTSYSDGQEVTGLAEAGGSVTLYAQWGKNWLAAYQPTIDEQVTRSHNLNMYRQNGREITAYALYDLDGNGVPELFLGTPEGHGGAPDATGVEAIFTYDGDHAVLLYDLPLAMVRAYIIGVGDGHVLEYGVGGAFSHGKETYRLEGNELVGEAYVGAEEGRLREPDSYTRRDFNEQDSHRVIVTEEQYENNSWDWEYTSPEVPITKEDCESFGSQYLGDDCLDWQPV